MQFLRRSKFAKIVLSAASLLIGISPGNLNVVPIAIASSLGPSIVTQPISQGILAGQVASFSVTASSTEPMSYQWSKNGIPIQGATSSSHTTLAETTADDRAQFAVVVTDSQGSVTSNSATLTVMAGSLSAPVIIAQPVSQQITAGQVAVFSVTASGAAPLTYQWIKNGVPIGGATSFSYITPPETTGDDRALFSVMVFSSGGIITSTLAILTVLGSDSSSFPSSPSTRSQIISQPVSQAIDAGQSATFFVAVSGTGPLSYQWSKNGVPIPGANLFSYITPAETIVDDRAQFAVTVSDSAGSTISNPATLTVTGSDNFSPSTLSPSTLSPSTSSLNFGTVTIGSNNTLNVMLANFGSSVVNISNVTISGPGFSASGVSSGLIIPAGQTASLSVTFAPATDATSNGSVTIISNASPITISLFGTGVEASAHPVTLNWDASNSAISGYYVYRSTVSGGFYSLLNSVPVTSTQFTDFTVQSGQTYYYVVTAVDLNDGQSGFSNEASTPVP